MQKQIKKIIRQKLEHTLDCKYKKAVIPQGWAVVEIEIFASELAEELKDYMDRKTGGSYSEIPNSSKPTTSTAKAGSNRYKWPNTADDDAQGVISPL